MKNKYFLLGIISLIFILMCSFSFASNWSQTGGNEEQTYVTRQLRTFYNESFERSTSNSNKGSIVEPLIFNYDNDSDLTNEIIIFKDNELRIYRGALFGFVDSYTNTSLHITGNAEAIDWDNDNKTELIFITEASTDNFQLWSLEWDGAEFTFDSFINGTNSSNGISCDNLYGDSSPECCFIGGDNNLYCYNHTDTGTVSASAVMTDLPCLNGSIPRYIDINEDGIKEVSFINNGSCAKLQILTNNQDGTFTSDYTIVMNRSISQYSLANLDGSTLEMIVTTSNYCSNALSTVCQGSNVDVYNALTGVFSCGKGYSNLIQWDSPYITGLHTCYYEDDKNLDTGIHFCDSDNNDFGEAGFLLISTGQAGNSVNATLRFIDETCTETFVGNLSGGNLNSRTGTHNIVATTNWGKPVWANFDSNRNKEIFFLDVAWNKGGVAGNDYPLTSNEYHNEQFMSTDSYYIMADISGNGILDILTQHDADNITIYSFNYSNKNPVFSNNYVNPANPVCVNVTVTFKGEYSDDEQDAVRLSVDCFGNGTLTSGDYDYTDGVGNVTATCSYPQEGTYFVKMYLQDQSSPDSLETVAYHNVEVSNDAICNNPSDDFTEISSSETGDMAEALSTIWGDMGLKSTASKLIIAMILLFIITIVMALKQLPSTVILITDVVLLIGMVALGLIPVWVVLVMLIVGLGILFLRTFLGAGGG